LNRAEYSINIKKYQSSCFLIELLVLVGAKEILPEIDTGVCPEEEELGALTEQRSASELSRVFAISAKLTDLVKYWL
jgi:peroxiredoxin